MAQLDISAALQIIDAGLGDMTDRELVSTAEMTNLLLDVRALLSSDVEAIAPPTSPETSPTTEAV
jgi:hypothetical protein